MHIIICSVDWGMFVRHRRKALDWTQTELATRAGVSLPTIQNLEAKKGNPTVAVLEKISQILGYSLKVMPVKPNWGLLHKAGLPIEVDETYPQQVVSRDLVQHLFLAMDDLAKRHHSSEIHRLEEAVAALIMAIKHHYPLFYSYCLKDFKTERFLSKYPMEGRMIKLMRMAVSGLSRVL